MNAGSQLPFWKTLERFGAAPALITDARTLGFAELAEHADALAATLNQQAGRAGRLLIAVVMTPDIDVIALYLGALRAGHVVLLSDDSILADTNPIGQRFPFDLKIHADAEGQAVIIAATDPVSTVTLHPDLSLLLSTSGSTGEPKLVRLSSDAVQSNAAAIVSYLGISADSRALMTLPLFYSYGMSVLHSQLSAGGALILTTASVIQPEFWDMGRKYGATSLALVPHQVQLIAKSPMADYPLPTLRYVTQAGGRLAPDQVTAMAEAGKAAGWDFFVMYGQTEAAPRISYVPPDLVLGAPDTIGRAIPGGTLELRREDGTPITHPGVPGELFYAGPNVMMGYASSPAELTDPARTSELATGDLAEWTDQGLVRIVGRIKRFIKLYGKRISLDQIETHLAAQGISAHAVGNDTQLVLFSDPDARTDPAGAADLVADLIEVPANDILSRPLSQPPLLPSGKIDYKALDAMAATVIHEERAAESTGSVDLRQLMAQITRTRDVKDTDSFTNLGGDSLGFLQITMALEKNFGFVPEGWEKMPLKQLNALKPSATPRAELSMDVLVRILAISLIVINHTLKGGFNGGTWVLLMTMGISFFRFQLPALGAQHPGRVLFKMLYPVLPLYFLILVALLVVGKQVPLPLLTLTANLGSNDAAFYFNVNWFISLYAQLALLLVLVFSIPKLRHTLQRQPFVWACGLFALSLLGSVIWQAWLAGWFDGVDHNLDSIFRVGSPLTCLPMVALGAMITFSQGRRQQLVVLGAVVLNTVIFPTLSLAHVLSLLIGGGLLASGWVVRTPLWVGQVARHMASAALFVYLLHLLVIRGFRDVAGVDIPSSPFVYSFLILVVSFLVSWIALSIFRIVETRGFALLSRNTTKTTR